MDSRLSTSGDATKPEVLSVYIFFGPSCLGQDRNFFFKYRLTIVNKLRKSYTYLEVSLAKIRSLIDSLSRLFGPCSVSVSYLRSDVFTVEMLHTPLRVLTMHGVLNVLGSMVLTVEMLHTPLDLILYFM